MDTDLWKNIQYIASVWILNSFAVGDQLLNILSGFYTDIIDMWGMTAEVSKIKEPETRTLTNEITDVIVHIEPDLKEDEQIITTPPVKKNTLKVPNKNQEDLDKITVDLEAERKPPTPAKQECKGKEHLIKEITGNTDHAEICFPSSLVFIGVFFMFTSLVAMTYWLAKQYE